MLHHLDVGTHEQFQVELLSQAVELTDIISVVICPIVTKFPLLRLDEGTVNSISLPVVFVPSITVAPDVKSPSSSINNL